MAAAAAACADPRLDLTGAGPSRSPAALAAGRGGLKSCFGRQRVAIEAGTPDESPTDPECCDGLTTGEGVFRSKPCRSKTPLETRDPRTRRTV